MIFVRHYMQNHISDLWLLDNSWFCSESLFEWYLLKLICSECLPFDFRRCQHRHGDVYRVEWSSYARPYSWSTVFDGMLKCRPFSWRWSAAEFQRIFSSMLRVILIDMQLSWREIKEYRFQIKRFHPWELYGTKTRWHWWDDVETVPSYFDDLSLWTRRTREIILSILVKIWWSKIYIPSSWKLISVLDEWSPYSRTISTKRTLHTEIDTWFNSNYITEKSTRWSENQKTIISKVVTFETICSS